MEKKSNLTIRANGLWFYLLLALDIFLLSLSVFVLVWGIIDVAAGKLAELINIILAILCISCFILDNVFLFKLSKIEFTEDRVMAPKRIFLEYPDVNVKCADLVECKEVSKAFTCYYELTCADKSVVQLYTYTFSKKQRAIVLQEIKNRGGLAEKKAKAE